MGGLNEEIMKFHFIVGERNEAAEAEDGFVLLEDVDVKVGEEFFGVKFQFVTDGGEKGGIVIPM
jgi:hypothetical protein